MMMYQFKAPHRNWLPGPEYLDLYRDTTLAEPATLFDDWRYKTAAAEQQAMTISDHLRAGWDLKIPGGEDWDRLTRQFNEDQLERFRAAYEEDNEAYEELEGNELTRWKYQRYIKDYLRTIAAVDRNVGRVLDYLETSGLAENTIVVYTSDQGFYLGDHNWFDKRWMYEESLEIPLLIRWPGVVEPGTESDALVQNLDFPETFLDVAGLEVPDDMQGRSLEPILRNGGEAPSDWRDAIYYHYYEYPGAHSVRRHYGIRTQRYKLMHFYHLGDWELYDLARDPEELNSVHDNPRYDDTMERLRGRLEDLRDRYEVPAEDPYPDPE